MDNRVGKLKTTIAGLEKIKVDILELEMIEELQSENKIDREIMGEISNLRLYKLSGDQLKRYNEIIDTVSHCDEEKKCLKGLTDINSSWMQSGKAASILKVLFDFLVPWLRIQISKRTEVIKELGEG